MRVKSLFLMVIMTLVSVSVAAQTTVEVVLAGHNSVPTVRSSGTGILDVTVEGDSLFVSGSFEDLREYYLGASIHFGRADETGNQIYRLTAELNEDKTSGEFNAEENRFELREAQKEALRNGRMYISIRSNRNRSGEIRGQIPPMNF
ncbi:CHRD domain-containing protein [Rhodohalobacter barkolensis]|uniref:CHRD domain-containing protein n=1 Tax=Rhodohalobacter barkolensis TaxID=2053187 RepID=A0A2N0VEJ9_9BACT|nr:CHRD domain-containing protein [Rhodohalobacter barkolensis]PKD42612.1 hypothetical protein CWD77_14485 [Rhodohalobacter barkolensis]